MYLVKLPNFLHIDTEAFNEETFEEERDDAEDEDEEANTRVKLKVENTVRWRPSAKDPEVGQWLLFDCSFRSHS